LAFRGTNDLGDWYSNLSQGVFGPLAPTQYNQAAALAAQVSQAVGGANLTMTGHSLGGGLASAAALQTNRSAVTFNAGALNELWLGNGGFSYSGSMVNYSVQGEILTTLQSFVFLQVFGEQRELKPAPVDAEDDPITLHGMEAVLHALGL
jgi:pimeloyl-ACP methyl ester carboxylesterase